MSIRLVPFLCAALLPCAAQFFDPSQVSPLHLQLAPGQWEQLQKDYLLDTYYEASLQWHNASLPRIAIRSRGNGSRNAAKPGLKLDFDKFTSGQTVGGLKSIVLDNLVQDASMMAEALSFQLFQKMSIPAPRLAYVQLFVNGHPAGLYTAVEPVDKLFLKRTLNQDSGYLYDYEWAGDFRFEDRGADPALYSPLPFAPKTNEKSPDPQPIADMVRVINAPGDLSPALAPFLNINKFLDYLATETYLAESDGIAGEWGLNNFYFYRLEGSKESIFIPWDKDVTFSAVDRSIWTNIETNVLTRRLLDIPEHRDYFFRALDRCASIAGGPGGWLDLEIERIATLTRPFSTADAVKPYSNGEVDDATEKLRRFAAGRVAFVREDIAR